MNCLASRCSLTVQNSRSVLLALLVLFVLFSFSATGNAASLRIAAASSLQFALNEIIDEYRQTHKDVSIQTVYGSNGAP